MNRYLSYIDYCQIIDFCNSKCKTILLESENNPRSISYYRGFYKGFLYSKKLTKAIFINKKPIKLYELYNILKEQRSKISYNAHLKREYINGIIASLYEFMNYINTL